ncbi:hypothetical protein TRVA0_009S02938 [Trichomonascus vanleenenianus]|uniref:uncharacterized protein n=1 Tax=Trichomonascus vanleenenianus TaxID=2268995 RepID=UPI003ECAE79B
MSSEEENQYYRAACKRIVHELDCLSRGNQASYCLVLISPNEATNIHSNPEMEQFVQKFLQEEDVYDYVSRNEVLPSRNLQRPHPVPEHTIDLSKPAEVEYYLEECLISLQQQACKTISKAWVRAIEPRKQTHYPYKLGDHTKPHWWPEHVRHKEPDHLMKPERIRLLICLLRCKLITIDRLRRATDECMSLLKRVRLPLLEEVYHVAYMERMYYSGKTQESKIAVSFMNERVKQGIKIRSKWAQISQKPQNTGPKPIPRPPIRPRPPVNRPEVLTPPPSSSTSEITTRVSTPEPIRANIPSQEPHSPVSNTNDGSAPSTPLPIKDGDDTDKHSSEMVRLKQESTSPLLISETVSESSLDASQSDHSIAFLGSNSSYVQSTPSSSAIPNSCSYHEVASCAFGSPFCPHSNPVYPNFFYNPTAGWPSDPLMQFSGYFLPQPPPASSVSCSSPALKHAQPLNFTPIMTPSSLRRLDDDTPTKSQ